MIFPFYTIFLSDPILPNGAVSGNWLLIGLAAILTFFLVRFVNQIDKLTKEVQSLRQDHTILRRDFDSKYTEDYVEGQNARIAEIIYAKIKGITPP